MKKQLFKLLTMLTIVTILVWQSGIVAGLLKPGTAYAVAGLLIDWGVTPGQPIFAINNMAPGQTESRIVRVKNSSSDPLPVGIRGMLKSQTGNLETVLEIQILQGAVPLYGQGSTTGVKTLHQFFLDAPMPFFVTLSNLTLNQTVTYTIKVTLPQSAGNQFQKRNLLLDLRIGPNFVVPDACKNISFVNEPIYGTTGNDIINGTDGNDVIFALKGNDVINAKKGNDCIIGDQGNDILNAGQGDDVAIGNDGNDEVHGDPGNDLLYAGTGNDHLDGSSGKDTCVGGKLQSSCEIKL